MFARSVIVWLILNVVLLLSLVATSEVVGHDLTGLAALAVRPTLLLTLATVGVLGEGVITGATIGYALFKWMRAD